MFWASRYRLTMAASKNGLHYGDVDWNDFRTRTVSSKRAIKDFLKFSKNDQELCLGKTAAELIIFLEDRKFIICPKNAKRNNDGTCTEGMTPYDYYSNRSKDENLKKRNEWIISKCPKLHKDEEVRKMVEKRNICGGKSGQQIIKIIGKNPFYICKVKGDLKDKKTGLCKGGFIPYLDAPLLEDSKKEDLKPEDYLRARDEWIMKFCPLESKS